MSNEVAGDYRLIWFQHLSKSAGTSIVELAMANDEKFYPQHSNGNPRNNDGTLIRFWDMDSYQLRKFVDECEHEGITFVATEWGAPDFSALASDPRVTLITCLRDPLERFMSNYYYGFYLGYTDCPSPESYANSEKTFWGTYTRSNYYCRIFSRCHHETKVIGLCQFELAKTNLAYFDYCVLISGKESFKHLKSAFGWKGDGTHANRTNLDAMTLSRHILTGKFHLLWRRFAYPKKPPGSEFVNHFSEKNVWDYKLMKEAQNHAAD
ncbi:sulfotransferase family 2 domain-containing protein [Pseudomonadota bacterium]